MIMETLLLQIDSFRDGPIWFMPLFFMAICVVLFLVFRKGGRGPFFSDRTRHMNNTDDTKTSAMDILKIRYAKGEITKEEYDKMKQDIS